MCAHFMKINAELQKTHPRVAMNSSEAQIFSEMMSVMLRYKNDLSGASFSEEAMKLLNKLMIWPPQHLSAGKKPTRNSTSHFSTTCSS